MCGIAGIFIFKSKTPSGEMVAKMVSALHHRGPDSSGVYSDGGCSIGHARLSIIDLSEAGRQPMVSAGGGYVIAFNGEVYNFSEIRNELEAKGYRFRGHSDTEVIVNAFEVWGPAIFHRLNGIFGLAIWDLKNRTLWLARDRFGAKPLYYAYDKSGGRLAFSSEIGSLLESGVPSRVMRESRLHEFLYYGSVSCNATMYEDIERVPPGHYLKFDETGLSAPEAYWSPESLKPLAYDYGEAVERTRSLLEQAVRRQLVADVPVGVFLSGGIDSSALTAFASRHYSGRLKSYSVGFDYEKGVNELPKAKALAARFGTEHHELNVSANDLTAVVESLVRHHHEPFSDAANIPLYLLCRAISGEIKVVLQGDGGDEFFGGYRRYNLLDNYGAWRLGAMLSKTFGGVAPSRIRRILEAFACQNDGVRMALLMTMEAQKPSPLRVLAPALRDRVQNDNPFLGYEEVNRRFEKLDRVQRMLYTDTQVILPDIFLEKVDKSTMAWGVEARVPFLDNDLTEFAMSLPSAYKVAGGQKKRLLRAALRGVVPDSVLDGPKTGFGVPYAHWLRTGLHEHARAAILESAGGSDPIFDEVTVTKLLDELKEQGRHGFLLWKCYQLALWRRL